MATASNSLKGWWTVGSRRWVITIVAVAAVLLLGTGWSWWHYVRSNPTRVFKRMLETSLSTASVSKHVTQADSSQQLDQVIELRVQPQPIARAVNTLDQGQGAATVVTESIGVPDTDFVRYVSIKTTQKNAVGKDFDFSSVLGLWGKADASDPTSTNNVQLFNQTLLGIVPFANVPVQARQQLLAQIAKDDVYKVNYGAVKRDTVNGRPTYHYSVSVTPVAYINMLKAFTHDIGMTRLDSVDASQYEGSAPISFTFDVDVWSSQLVKVSYADSGRVETYSAYGARIPIRPPAVSLPVDEIQNRLEQIH